MKQRIMIIEDNQEIVELITLFLEQEGFETCSYETAELALQNFDKDKPDLITLDINLPGMSGFDFIPLIRQKSSVPILCLTARTTDIDVVTGLGNGADDYIPKPFSSIVLTAHIKALLRRAQSSGPGQEQNEVRFGPYTFIVTSFILQKEDMQIPLSMRECRLLDYLIKNNGASKTPETIYKDVWQNEYGDLTTVGVYIQRLRKKIEDDPKNPKYILTTNGEGYSFNAQEIIR